MTKDAYRPSEAARILHISRATIYRYFESGRLLPVKDAIGRNKIPHEQIENFRPCTR